MNLGKFIIHSLSYNRVDLIDCLICIFYLTFVVFNQFVVESQTNELWVESSPNLQILGGSHDLILDFRQFWSTSSSLPLRFRLLMQTLSCLLASWKYCLLDEIAFRGTA